MSTSGARVAVAVIFLAAAPAVRGERIPVTACQQEITRGTGELTVDLDCSADPLAVGVSVNRGNLHLNGHSITGASIGVACMDHCKIYGPGTINGNGVGIDQFASRSDAGRVTVRDVTITGNVAGGLGGDRIRVMGSTITGNGGFVVEGNAIGGGIIASQRVTVRSSTVDGNDNYGICSPQRITLGNSTAQGNGTAPGCDPDPVCGACGDLVSSRRPMVSATSACDVSVDPPSGTWGVCSAD
jgi:hypothetical protein